MERYRARETTGFVSCVGLDPNPDLLPHQFKMYSEQFGASAPIQAFLTNIVDATHTRVGTFKPNIAFYQTCPNMLRELIAYIRAVSEKAVAVIVDGKWGDIGSTNQQTADFAFNYLGADAITIHGWPGREAMLPFISRPDKGVFVVCRTSNPGANEFQSRIDQATGLPLFALMAERVAHSWNILGNCGLVVGGTCPIEDIQIVRRIIGPGMPILMPGFGKQGGDVATALQIGLDEFGCGVLPANSRAIIHAATADATYQEAAVRALVEFNAAIALSRAKNKPSESRV